MRLLPGKLKEIRDILWNILTDLDDLSAATSSVMRLLAKFYSITGDHPKECAIFFSDELAVLVPRLYPFLRHNLVSVRRAAVEMLELITAPASSKKWLSKILVEITRYIFQNIILESKQPIVQSSLKVWQQIVRNVAPEQLLQLCTAFFASWVNLLSTTQGASLDLSLLLLPSSIKEAMSDQSGSFGRSSGANGKDKKKRGRPKKGENSAPEQQKLVELSDDMKTFDIRVKIEDTEEYVNMKIAGTSALAYLLNQCYSMNPKLSFQVVFDTIGVLLDSQWAVHRQVAGLFVQELHRTSHALKLELPGHLVDKIITLVAQQDQASYSEMQAVYSQYLNDCNMYLQLLMSFGVDVTPYITNQTVSLESADLLVNAVYDHCFKALNNSNQTQAASELTNKRGRVQAALDFYKSSAIQISTSTIGLLCSSLTAMPKLPRDEYLTSVVNGLMSSVQREKKSLTLQQRSSESLAELVSRLCETHGAVNEQIVSNLCLLLSSTMPSDEEEKQLPDEQQGITDTKAIQRGSNLALCKIVETLGEKVFEKIPCLWRQTGQILTEAVKSADTQPIITALHIVKVIAPSLHKSLLPRLELLLQDKLLTLSTDSIESVSMRAAKTIATLCKVFPQTAMKIVYSKLLPLLSDPQNISARRGSVRALSLIVSTLDMDILPYVVLFVVPLLKRMSDNDTITRETASSCFGNVIKILPLEKAVASIPEFEPIRERERKFVEQLLDNSKVEPYEIKVKINAELRQYQKDGVSWLAFLNKFNLHGILCDDMGLGKTIQTLCILASDIEDRRRMYEQTKLPEYVHLPSLVVCPPTLVGHWFYEVKKFCPSLSPMQYLGNPQVRKALRSEIPNNDIIILSYDILRNDIDHISTTDKGEPQIYNYCILDEGHIIKNSKTKVTKAVKKVLTNHRLLLSGTPIQNNVLELWSLFDFLMPGFLGSEKEFNQKYGKPILASREAKANSKEHEAGALALEALHRQVLPFLLRRVKEDVLHDLPEKIIQDYYCELSPLQWRLYEDFSKKYLPNEIEEDSISSSSSSKEQDNEKGGSKEEGGEPKWHIFQALQYLRKLCNHPLLILNENHPEYIKIMAEIKDSGKDLHDISFSPKVQALKELLQQCGLGLKKKHKGEASSSAAEEGLETSSAAGHRVLVFAQLKSMLDIIENDLFKKHMPDLTYMRLDGGVESSKRHALVQKFNSDPTIDVLLLTTHVGGLGLNLTGADTVIFVEHDWNPSADLQAMDRAHRIGQKRVVNVYRLITKNTLEEKIMGLQKFKMNIQKSVVNRENSSLKTMDTSQLVDLFKLGASEEKKENAGNQAQTPGAASGILKDIGELWNADQQYEEFNLDSFMKTMKKQ